MAFKNSGDIKRVIQSVAGFFASPTTTPNLTNNNAPANVPVLPTGLRPLDKALGIGGLPLGKITELIHPGSTAANGGSTCLAARIAAKAQRQQKNVTIIDLSYNFDPWQAERCGLVAPQLLLVRPDTFFDALTGLENAARHTQLVIVVLGHIAQLLQNIDADLHRVLLRRLQKIARSSNSAFLIITAVPHNNPFDPTNYPPQFPLADLADLRLWTQDEAWSRKAGITTAYKANLTVIKNRLALAGKGANITIKLTAF